MFNILTDLANNQPEKPSRTDTTDYLEPYVAYYDIHSSDKDLFILPFKIIGWSLLTLTIAGLASLIIWQNDVISQVFLYMACILGPFYLPGVYYYFKCYKKEVSTRVELDAKYGLIKYENSERGRNILFHESQIENCIVKLSLLFPYKINYISLYLKGGYKVNISSLIVDPKKLVQQFKLPYTMETHWFNQFPKQMA